MKRMKSLTKYKNPPMTYLIDAGRQFVKLVIWNHGDNSDERDWGLSNRSHDLSMSLGTSSFGPWRCCWPCLKHFVNV